MKNDVYSEILHITGELIKASISISQNFPIISKNAITWENQRNISIALKNQSYLTIYDTLDKEKNYNIKMLDGALIQLMYRFSKNRMIEHRLAFFPSPSLERYSDVPDDYEQKYFGDSQYHDDIEKYIVTFPLRFDYSTNTTMFRDVSHPMSHLHLGQYEDCRIPVKSPISPKVFFDFILRNFYCKAYVPNLRNYLSNTQLSFVDTITPNEKKIIHINLT